MKKLEQKSTIKEYLEYLAEQEYKQLAGKLVDVRSIFNIYDTFDIKLRGKPTIVRILEGTTETDLFRWTDGWLDSIYLVEIVQFGDFPKSLDTYWIYGNSRSLYGGFEPSDIYNVITRIKDTSKVASKIDIDDIAKRMGAERCYPPPKYRNLMGYINTGFMDDYGFYDFKKR